MNFLKKVWMAIRSGRFWLHIGLAIVLFILLVFLLFRYLDVLTLHGESITVPPMVGMTLEEANEFLEDKNMDLRVIDSVYNPNLEPGEIINQVPKEGSKVKDGRNIYLTIRSYIPEQGMVPDIESLSLRNAESKLKNAGFVVGEKIYKPYKYPNTVIYISKDGVKVPPGARFSKGTELDLVVGNGLGETNVTIPDLRGMQKRDAEAILFGGYELNVGNVHYHESVVTARDSANARVYEQDPEPQKQRRIGEFVDLYLMSEEVFELLKDTMEIDEPAMDATELPLDTTDQNNL